MGYHGNILEYMSQSNMAPESPNIMKVLSWDSSASQVSFFVPEGRCEWQNLRNGGFQSHEGTPIAGWFSRDFFLNGRFGGISPICGNH